MQALAVEVENMQVVGWPSACLFKFCLWRGKAEMCSLYRICVNVSERCADYGREVHFLG